MDDYGYGHAQRLAESGDMGWGTVLAFAVLGIAALIFIFGSFFTVEQQTVAVVERLGKFIGTAQPGLNFKLPIIDSASRRVTLRVQQLEVPVTTKTHDNTFVTMKIVVQYQVIADRVFDAAYKLANPATQITSYVEDVVRAQVPKLALDAVFSEKDTVANTVKTELVGAMAEYGFLIVKTLVVDIAPDAKVQDAMNDINAAQRLRVAANERGEAEKTLAVKRAEAEAESKRLQGEGTAQQRLAIARGIQTSLALLKDAGVDPHEATAMMLMTQYLDMMTHVGANSRTNTILLPHSPGATGALLEQITSGLLAGRNPADAPAVAAANGAAVTVKPATTAPANA